MCHCVHVYTECVHHILIKVKSLRICVFAFIEHLCACAVYECTCMCTNMYLFISTCECVTMSQCHYVIVFSNISGWRDSTNVGQ